jgi:hypothetical protein
VGGRLNVIASIEQPALIENILVHLRQQTSAVQSEPSARSTRSLQFSPHRAEGCWQRLKTGSHFRVPASSRI